MSDRASRGRFRRGLILGVAALLTVSALIAVVVLLAGASGATAGRILGTTTTLAGCGVLALPAASLLDSERLPALARSLLALIGVTAVLVLAAIWSADGVPVALAKAATTAGVAALALAQIAALVARRRGSDPPVVGPLLLASSGLAALLAGIVAAVVWSDSGSPAMGRVIAALMVLDVLAVALQPILARARAAVVRLRVGVTTDRGREESVVTGRDTGAAVASAIRAAETRGAQVRSAEVIERSAAGEPPRMARAPVGRGT